MEIHFRGCKIDLREGEMTLKTKAIDRTLIGFIKIDFVQFDNLPQAAHQCQHLILSLRTIDSTWCQFARVAR